jgi:hypothetical protein
MSVSAHLRNLSRPLVQYRVILSFGLSAACGIFLESLYPVHDADPMLRPGRTLTLRDGRQNHHAFYHPTGNRPSRSDRYSLEDH